MLAKERPYSATGKIEIANGDERTIGLGRATGFLIQNID